MTDTIKTPTDAEIEAMPVWRNFVGLWPESRREIVDAVVELLAAAPTPAAQGDAWPSDDEVRAAYKDAFGLTPAGAIWLNLGILAEALRTRRAALAQKEGGHA